MKIYERSQDPDPVFIASAHIKLAELYENQENKSQASFHMRRAIDNYKKIADANDPTIVNLERYLETLSETEKPQEKKRKNLRNRKKRQGQIGRTKRWPSL